MFERIKELLRHSAIYGLGSIVARIVGVLLLPLYTRYLSPSDYGLIETLVALSAVLTALVAQGMKSAFFRFYFDSAEPARRLLVVRTAFWYVLAASTSVSAIERSVPTMPKRPSLNSMSPAAASIIIAAIGLAFSTMLSAAFFSALPPTCMLREP